MQKRMLYTLKQIEKKHPSETTREYIKAFSAEMEAEDVAYVEKLVNEG